MNNPQEKTKLSPDEYLRAWYDTGKFCYVNGQLEKGENGTLHLQYYLSAKTQVRKSALIKHCKHTDYTPVKIDNGASNYCLKADTRVEGPWEFGIKPVRLNNKTDWADVWAKAKEGKLEEIPDYIRVTHYNKLKSITKDYAQVEGQAGDVKGIWIYGPAGIGKSRYAREKWPNAYKKLANKWFDGYQGHQYILMEDLDKKHSVLDYHLKIWADRYHAPGETKGGMVPLIHEKIIVTSQYHPD